MNLLLPCLLMIGWQDAGQVPAKPVNPPPAQEAFWIDFHSPEQVQGKPPTSLEQAISQALVNHPDMRLAEAELRVAEAKLAQAKIVVSQKVSEDFHRLEKERADVEVAKAKWERVSQMQKDGMISSGQAKEAQYDLSSAKARLATTESSWKLMMGNQVKGFINVYEGQLLYRTDFIPQRNQLDELNKALGVSGLKVQPEQYIKGLILNEIYSEATNTIDQLKLKLEVKVKLDKQTNLDLEQAFQKVTEGAGIKLRIRLPITENKIIYKEVTHFDFDASEYPLHTWLQLIVDEMNSYQALSAPQRQETPKRFDLYVREYGLLLTSRDLAPPDAMTVQELWKQVRLEKAAKEAKKAQENAAPKK